MRKPFTTTIEESVQKDFREVCVANDMKLNEVLETLMDAYIKGELHIEKKIQYSVSELKK